MSSREVPTSSAVMYRPPSDSTKRPNARNSASDVALRVADDHGLAAAEGEAGDAAL